MAFPRCPRCGARDVPRRRRANSIMAAESEVYRSYRCACGWSAWSCERVFAEDTPTDWIEKRFSRDDEAASAQPCPSRDS